MPLSHLAVSFVLGCLVVVLGRGWSTWLLPHDWWFGAAWLLWSWTAALVIHVTGHVAAARWSGRGTYRCVLWIFGDSPADYRLPETSPREVLVAVSGPLANVFACALAAILWWIDGSSLRWPGIAWLALGAASAVVGIVNLLPGLPLDGGRIVTALLLYLHGGSPGVVRLALALGRLMALVLLTLAVLVLQVEVRAAVPGLWLGWLGWTLGVSLRSERRRLAVALSGAARPVASLVGVQARVEAAKPISQVAELFLGPERGPVALVSDGEAVVGVLLTERLVRALRHDGQRTVADVMVPLDRLPHVGAQEPASVALQLLLESGLPAVVVIEGQRVIGALTQRAVERISGSTTAAGRRVPE
jgi:Zn-dependent protease